MVASGSMDSPVKLQQQTRFNEGGDGQHAMAGGAGMHMQLHNCVVMYWPAGHANLAIS